MSASKHPCLPVKLRYDDFSEHGSPRNTKVSEATEMTFAPLKNDLILRAAKGEKVERPPIWIMVCAILGRLFVDILTNSAHHFTSFTY